MINNKKEAEISVILPLYNGSRYIKEQLESILEQTFKHFEIIIVDDASTDNSVELAELQLKYYDFTDYTIHRNKVNLGPNNSFEIGVTISRGSFIAFCDQDDIWKKNKLEELINRINEKEIDLVYSQSLIMKGNRRTRKKYPRQDNSSNYFTRLQHNNARGASMMIRRSFLESILPFSHGDIYDKWIYFISILIGKVQFIEIPLDYYRAHDQNVIGTKFNFSKKSKIILKLKYKIQFYNDLLTFLNNRNFKNKEVLYSINSIITFLDNMKSCIESRSYNCLGAYNKNVLSKKFYFKEKLVFLYYYLII